MSFDPYAPPESAIGSAPLARADGVRRDGKELVIDLDAGESLPDFCLKCGQPADGFRLRRKLQWHPSWVYLLIMLNIIFYAIGALATRKTMQLALPLCEQHRGRRSRLMWASAAVMVLCMIGCAGGISLDHHASGFVILVAAVLGFSALIALFIVQSPLRAKRIDQLEGRFLGAKPAFLDRLPSGL